jgi:hypothetical protein
MPFQAVRVLSQSPLLCVPYLGGIASRRVDCLDLPASMAHGTPDLVVIVNGEDFEHDSTINWNGVPLSRPYR